MQVESLGGLVERITFHSEETGFCVLRVKVKGKRDLLTITGNVASIAPGEEVHCKGVFENDKKHGLQFKAHTLLVVPPATLEGIEKYLGSGIVRGIGPHFAQKLITAFGDAVFEVIEQSPARLLELEGIGLKRQQQIVSAWAEQKAIRDIMVFLQSHGVSTARAVRIYKTYGEHAVKRVLENPYRLALDIRGIGFKTADSLAIRLGIPKDSILRAQAGILHVLQELCERGHCAIPEKELIAASIQLLDIPDTTLRLALVEALREKHLVVEAVEGETHVFPSSLYHAEVGVVAQLKRLSTAKAPWGSIDVAKAIPWVEVKTAISLSKSQQQAITTVLQQKVSVITGGPGVGKTTIVKSILEVMRAKRMHIALCAPTGRAARRLKELTQITAKTIHRLLEFDPKTHSFKHHGQNPLALDVLVVDEASMIDIVLFYQLLKAIPSHAALILVGDVDQLPSVGPGAVLWDIIHSRIVPMVRLTEIFRQAASSKIIINAHRINQGSMPLPNDSPVSDFYTLYFETPDEIHHQLVELVSKRLPSHLKCNAITDIQVLTPMNRSGLGASALNVTLQEHLNGNAEPKITRFGSTFAPGDKVIQQVNNYDKEVYNGDIGFIQRIDQEENVVHILFDQRMVTYEFNELDELNLAYAISIHKSQGSEFPVVVLPVALQHFSLLARNLLYTGVTRGKRLVVVLAQKKAMVIAVRNIKQAKRITKLSQRLRECFNVAE